jgi:tetratricopeptide (TPR) repeat protein
LSERKQIKAGADSITSIVRLIDDEMRGEEQLRQRALGNLTPEVTHPFKSDKKKRSQYMAPSAPRVFISYSHDSAEHKECALRFAQRLRKDRIDAQLDQYVGGRPAGGWPRWMLDKLDWADFVLLICTETYHRRFRGHEQSDMGKGVDWEGQLITLEIYNAKSRTTKFVPIIFAPRDKEFIPEPLSDQFYCLDSKDRYQELYSLLTGQAGVPLPELGPAKEVPRKDIEPMTFGGLAEKSPSTGSRDAIDWEIPPPSANFTNRDEDLAHLQAEVREEGCTIIGIFGMGGVGKTELAKKFAVEVKELYPDGQLYFHLKGMSKSPQQARAAPAYVIDKVSRGVTLPDTLDELSKLYCSVLYDKQVLIFLDDAASADQVSHLAPPRSCLLVITGRRGFYLPGTGMVTTNLELLELPAAIKFLKHADKRIGPYAQQIARLCGRLPISLELAAKTIKERPDLRVSQYVKALETNVTQRQALIDPVIKTSYDLLIPIKRKQQWCALACFVDEFERAAAAVLWDLPEDQTDETLGSLCNRSMVLYNEILDRYHLHDLTRLFAKRHLANPEVYRRRHAAYFLQYALAHRHPLIALDVVAQDIFATDEWCEEERQRSGQSQVTFAAALLRTNESEAAWALYLVARLFKRNGKYRAALDRYTVCLEFARTKGVRSLEGACLRSIGETHYRVGGDEAAKFEDYLRQALDTLRQGDDVAARKELVFTLLCLAEHQFGGGDDEQAKQFARESLQVRDMIPLGERYLDLGLANGAMTLIRVYERHHNFEEAYKLLCTERENLAELDRASISGHVGCMMRDIRRWREAEELFDNAAGLYRRLGNYAGVSWIKRCAGELYDLREQPLEARACYQEALSTCKAAKLGPSHVSVAMLELARFHFRKLNTAEGDRSWAKYEDLRPQITDADTESKIRVAVALTALGKTLHDQQRVALAADILKEAAELYHSVGNLGGEAYVYQVLAEESLLQEAKDAAEKHYHRSVELRVQNGDQERLACALEEIGRSYFGVGDMTAATKYWTRALEIYNGLGKTVYEDRVRDLLKSAGSAQGGKTV